MITDVMKSKKKKEKRKELSELKVGTGFQRCSFKVS